MKNNEPKILEEGLVKVTPNFTPNILAQIAYYKGVEVSEFINFETTDKDALAEIIKEMSKLLVEVGTDYRVSKK